MAKSAIATRLPAMEGAHFANSAVTIQLAPPASRISLRATKAGSKSIEKLLGITLPKKPTETTKKTSRHALWLGPDEWMVIDEKNGDASMVPRQSNKNFTAVDVSHRNVAYIVNGYGAANTLNAGCPRDLSLRAFPVGSCSRTILNKAEVVLYRTARNTFRIECWRSFAPYVWAYLLEGAKDAHI
ncbi:MAG: sarcosine oxidase subunit gamma [Rhizobiaceae bacterium]